MQPTENQRRSPIHTLKINEAVYLWFYSFRSKGLPTSGPIIKAEILSKKFPDKNADFKTGEGWSHMENFLWYLLIKCEW